MMPNDLDSLINDILTEMEKEKEIKKLEKKFATHFIIRDEKVGGSRETSFGKPARLLSTISVENLQKAYDSLLPQLVKGEKIINTNLEALGIVLKNKK